MRLTFFFSLSTDYYNCTEFSDSFRLQTRYIYCVYKLHILFTTFIHFVYYDISSWISSTLYNHFFPHHVIADNQKVTSLSYMAHSENIYGGHFVLFIWFSATVARSYYFSFSLTYGPSEEGLDLTVGRTGHVETHCFELSSGERRRRILNTLRVVRLKFRIW